MVVGKRKNHIGYESPPVINRIRDIRKQKGMTLAEVAAACDPPTTAQTIGRLETGMRNLSLVWMNRIAAALGVDPELLVKGEAAEQPQVVARLTESRRRGAARPARRDPAGRARRRRAAAVPRDRRAAGRIPRRRPAVAAAGSARGRAEADQPRRAGAAFGRALRLRAADRPPGHARRAAAAGRRPAADRGRQPGLAGGGGDAGPQAVKRLLSIATLYPNAHQPRFGTFVARQMEALAARGDWDVTVVNPIGVPPVAAGALQAAGRGGGDRRRARRDRASPALHADPGGRRAVQPAR